MPNNTRESELVPDFLSDSDRQTIRRPDERDTPILDRALRGERASTYAASFIL